MSLLTSKKRTKGRKNDLVDQSTKISLPDDLNNVSFLVDAIDNGFEPASTSAVLREATSALPDALSTALDDGSSQLAQVISKLPEPVAGVLSQTSSDLAEAASALPDSLEAAAGTSSELATAGAALPEAVESVLSDLSEDLPDGQLADLPADQIGRLAAARAATMAATARAARSGRTAAARQARRQAQATAEVGRRAGRQAGAAARVQAQVTAAAAQRQLDSVRESAQHLREATADVPIVQRLSPRARQRAAELEQARLRAAARRRGTLLVLLGIGVAGAVVLFLKRRADRAAAIEQTDDAPDLLLVEETMVTTVDLTDGSAETAGVVRVAGIDSSEGTAG